MNTPLPQYHRRNALLRRIDEAGSWRSVPGLWDAFRDEADLLQAAQTRWVTVLGSAVDVAIETGEGDLHEDVRRAYAAAADRHPGLRRLLEENQHHPAVESSIRREHAMVARAAGVAHSSEVIEPARQRVHVPTPRRSRLARIFASA